MDGLLVPTAPEMLRIKAFLTAERRATRDYVDLAALVDHLGEGVAAARLMRAIEAATGAGVLTPDLGGRARTADVTRAVCECIGE